MPDAWGDEEKRGCGCRKADLLRPQPKDSTQPKDCAARHLEGFNPRLTDTPPTPRITGAGHITADAAYEAARHLIQILVRQVSGLGWYDQMKHLVGVLQRLDGQAGGQLHAFRFQRRRRVGQSLPLEAFVSPAPL